MEIDATHAIKKPITTPADVYDFANMEIDAAHVIGKLMTAVPHPPTFGGGLVVISLTGSLVFNPVSIPDEYVAFQVHRAPKATAGLDIDHHGLDAYASCMCRSARQLPKSHSTCHPTRQLGI